MIEELRGTKTEENLFKAFTEESKAVVKYTIFADEADSEIVEEVFETAAKNELEHAEIFAELLGLIVSDITNLRHSIMLETMASSIDYKDMAIEAREEGFDDIADKFESIGKIEEHHKQTFEELVNLLTKGELYKRPQKQTWKCTKCGHEHIGYWPPDHCPVCEHDLKDYIIKSKNY